MGCWRGDRAVRERAVGRGVAVGCWAVAVGCWRCDRGSGCGVLAGRQGQWVSGVGGATGLCVKGQWLWSAGGVTGAVGVWCWRCGRGSGCGVLAGRQVCG